MSPNAKEDNEAEPTDSPRSLDLSGKAPGARVKALAYQEQNPSLLIPGLLTTLKTFIHQITSMSSLGLGMGDTAATKRQSPLSSRDQDGQQPHK